MHCPIPPFPELLDYSLLTKQVVRKKRTLNAVHTNVSLKRLTRDIVDHFDDTILSPKPGVSVYIKRMILDAVKRYEDFRTALPEYAYITVKINPTIHLFEGGKLVHRPYWPDMDNHIKITVSADSCQSQ